MLVMHALGGGGGAGGGAGEGCCVHIEELGGLKGLERVCMQHCAFFEVE